MFRPHITSVRRPAARRGALLIAVLGLLTLFAIFALFFVFYADAEATSARIHREAQSPGPDGEFPADYGLAAFNQTMNFAIYDDTDFWTGVLNPLRGHSLARSMYSGQKGVAEPFTGIGTFHEQAAHGTDRALWINYSAPFRTSVGPVPGDNIYFLDPEYNQFRLSAQVTGNQLPASLNHTFVPKNAPYTYPDLKDLILASVSPATGEVLVKSLHRDWLFNGSNANVSLRLAPWNPADVAPATNTAANTDWVTPEGRTRILRPRPVDQLTQGEITGAGLPYPIPPGLSTYSAAQKTGLYNLINSYIASGRIMGYPAPNPVDPATGMVTYTGDVQNLQGGVGVQKNDSILIDIGMQPRQWNGKWIKPLASILLTDLDGMLNINAHGNIRGMGTPGSHTSHNGFGPNEVNLGYVLGGESVSLVMARYGITSWAPNTNYTVGARVVNNGNFYLCVGPMGGGVSAPNPSPGPSGTYTAMSPYMDGTVQWADVSIQIPRNGARQLLMDPSGRRMPLYSAVNFDGGGNSPNIAYPSFPGNGFQTSITYSNGGSQSFYDDNFADGSPVDTYNKYLNHPLLWNVNDWGSGNNLRRWYPLSDLRRFNLRYAADRDWYTQTDVARAATANSSLIGTSAAGPSYRLDPAHLNRGLVTTISTGLDRGGILGNFNSSSGGQVLMLNPGQRHPVNATFQGTFAPGTGADYLNNLDWRNPRAALGPVDLNRTLTDYRSDPNTPLGSPSTVNASDTFNNGNYLQAWVDRQNLARDIFARLILATGANATVAASGDVTINATVGNPDYNALRYLAQLAANMVDAIDSDDVSTAFAWETGTAWGSPRTITTVDTTSLPLMIAAAAGQTPTGIVFGVEKPRLVINEAYGEITNDPNEMLQNAMPMQNNARVRFWIELQNPTSTPYTGTGAANSPLGTGGVTVHNGTFNPYQLVVVQNNAVNQTTLVDPTNVTGSLPLPGANNGFRFDFSTATPAQRTIQPVNGAYGPVNGTPGFILVGAADYGANQHTAGGSTVEFRPNSIAPFNTQMITGNINVGAMVTNSMEYDYGGKPTALNDLENVGNMNKYRRHVVLLQRLANPYQPFNAQTNPYITVDMMDYVPAFDAVVRGGAAGDTADRLPKAAAGITQVGFEPVDDTSGGNRRYSVGKVQPYAGFGSATAGGADVDFISPFPASMVIRQAPNPANASYPAAGFPLNSFFRQNGRNDGGMATPAPVTQTYTIPPAPPAFIAPGNETLMAPFDAYVHPDRPLVNQIELFSLQAVKPHEVTQTFVQVVNGALSKQLGLAPWLGLQPNPAPPSYLPGFEAANSRTNIGLYRALESLRVKPWTYGMPHGGKVHGKINLNTIQDPRVLQALLDPRNGNYFTMTEVNNLWLNLINPTSPVAGVPYRTQQFKTVVTAANSPMNVPLPGPTYDDVPNPSSGNFDRPFRSFGTAEFTADGSNAAFAARFGSGLQDTLLRVNPTTVPPQPLIWSTNTNVMVNGQADTGLQSEMLRKMMNNTTTTSHAFAVTITIVFHEVRLNGSSPQPVNEGAGNRYLIGKEAYKDVPGDLRQQFYSVVDRSNLVLNTSGIVHPQPISASLAQPVVLGNFNAPSSGAPMGFANNPVNSYNVYLDNSTSSGGGNNPFPPISGGVGLTVYADSKPFTIQGGMQLLFGVGANQEAVVVNHVNQDGSLNIGGTPPTPFGVTPTPFGRSHAAGDLVSNFQPGNPGPVSTQAVPNLSNPGPFELIIPPNQPSLYRAVVPYAVRVR